MRDLPLELVAHILRRLPPPALARARRVCRRWRAVVDGLPLADRGLPNPRVAAAYFGLAFAGGHAVAAAWLWDLYACDGPHPFGEPRVTHLRQVASTAGLRLVLRTTAVGREARVAFLRRALLCDCDGLPVAELARLLGLRRADLAGPAGDAGLTEAERALVDCAEYGCARDFRDHTAIRRQKDVERAVPAERAALAECVAVYAREARGPVVPLVVMACWVARYRHRMLTDDGAADLLVYLAGRSRAAGRALYRARPDLQARFAEAASLGAWAGFCTDGQGAAVCCRPPPKTGRRLDLCVHDTPLPIVVAQAGPHSGDALEWAIWFDRPDVAEYYGEAIRAADADAYNRWYLRARSCAMVDCLSRARPDGAPSMWALLEDWCYWSYHECLESAHVAAAYKFIRCGTPSDFINYLLIRVLAVTNSSLFGEFVDTVLADTLHSPRAVEVLLYALLVPSSYRDTLNPFVTALNGRHPAPAAVARYLARVAYAPTPGECVVVAHVLARASPAVAHVVAAALPGVRAALPPAWAPGDAVDSRLLPAWPRDEPRCADAERVHRDAREARWPLGQRW